MEKVRSSHSCTRLSKTMCSNRSKILYEAGLQKVLIFGVGHSGQLLPHLEQLCTAACSTLNALLRITAFPSLNSLAVIGVPSFVYRYYSKQNTSSRTYCYTEWGIGSKAWITEFALNSLRLISVPSFVYRYYSKQGISSRTGCYRKQGIQSKTRIYGVSN